MLSEQWIDGFLEPHHVSHAGVSLPVYTSIRGSKPLIVLHELPGMSPSFVAYCRRMADEGFQVTMPLLFHRPESNMTGWQITKLCISQEFRSMFYSRTSSGERPFTQWLQHLTRLVIDENPGQPVALLGMCLTGGFALLGFAERGVAAVICCQPAFPFVFGIKSLGLSESQLSAAVEGARICPAPCIKGYRYAGDRFCRKSHMQAIEDRFGSSFERYPDLKGSGHSTLTADSASEAVFEDVVKFLNERL